MAESDGRSAAHASGCLCPCLPRLMRGGLFVFILRFCSLGVLLLLLGVVVHCFTLTWVSIGRRAPSAAPHWMRRAAPACASGVRLTVSRFTLLGNDPTLRGLHPCISHRYLTVPFRGARRTNTVTGGPSRGMQRQAVRLLQR